MNQTTDKKEKLKEETKIIPVPEINAIIQQVDPIKEIDFAKRCASALVDVIKAKPKKVVINGEQYLEFGDWQTIARFYRTTVGIESVKELFDNGKGIIGYEAKAVVYANGEIISGAIASCTNEENNWKSKPMFQLKSMAQTRACAKGLRNVFGWVVELAGYKSTPAEEIDTEQALSNNSNGNLASSRQIKLIYDLIKTKTDTEKIKDKDQAHFWLSTIMDRPGLSKFNKMSNSDARLCIEFLNQYPKS